MTNAFKNLFLAVIQITKGSRLYYGWLVFLSFFIVSALYFYFTYQFQHGMIETAMRDQVSWGFYIANFTFLVGVAAAAVLLVIPAYVYHFKPIKEIVLFGEILAITAIIMCLLFVTLDLGRPGRALHILPPPIGRMNFPISMLSWDVVVLNGYLILNSLAVGYVLYSLAKGEEYKTSVMWPIVVVSIPCSFSIHTVTAFLYAGLSARSFWNTAVLPPRFIASALCSGPALMLIIFQIIRKVSQIEITDRAIFKIAELIAYAIAVNLFLFFAEVFTEFYASTHHVVHIKYLYFGLGEVSSHLAIIVWIALFCNILAFALFLTRRTREDFVYLNIACVLVFMGVYLEKGMGLVVPGFIPGTLGEIYKYMPSKYEMAITVGVWAVGAMVFTFFVKITIPLYLGKFTGKKEIKPYSASASITG